MDTGITILTMELLRNDFSIHIYSIGFLVIYFYSQINGKCE